MNFQIGTNACIASKCVTEAFKLSTSCSQYLNNYIVFNQSTGIYSYAFEAEKKADCLGNKHGHIFIQFSCVYIQAAETFN